MTLILTDIKVLCQMDAASNVDPALITFIKIVNICWCHQKNEDTSFHPFLLRQINALFSFSVTFQIYQCELHLQSPSTELLATFHSASGK